MKKKIVMTFRPKTQTALTEGVIQEMNRYDGGYDSIKRGKIIGQISNENAGIYYEWATVSGPTVTIGRWESFGLTHDRLHLEFE